MRKKTIVVAQWCFPRAIFHARSDFETIFQKKLIVDTLFEPNFFGRLKNNNKNFDEK